MFADLWSVEKARNWISPDEFIEWLARRSQSQRSRSVSPVKSRTVTPATTPSRCSGTPGVPPASARTPTAAAPEPRTPHAAREHLPAVKFTPVATPARQLSKTIEVISLLSDDEDDTIAVASAANAAVAPRSRGEKRRRSLTPIKEEVEVIDLDALSSSPLPKRIHRVKQEPTMNTTLPAPRNGSIRITRLSKVDELVQLDNLPWCWDVPRPGRSVAYLLDLTGGPYSEREWQNDKGAILSIAAMIKKMVSLSVHVTITVHQLISIHANRAKIRGEVDLQGRRTRPHLSMLSAAPPAGLLNTNVKVFLPVTWCGVICLMLNGTRPIKIKPRRYMHFAAG